IKRLEVRAYQMFGVRSVRCVPLNWWKIARAARGRCLVLSMAARQANRSYVSDVSLSGYFILAHPGRARDNWSSAFVTRISGDVKVLSSHRRPLTGVAALT